MKSTNDLQMKALVCLSAEIRAVLKVDNRIVGHTHWRQLGKDAWGQSFSIDLERVSGLHLTRVNHDKPSEDVVR